LAGVGASRAALELVGNFRTPNGAAAEKASLEIEAQQILAISRSLPIWRQVREARRQRNLMGMPLRMPIM
jgi:hypothetical protein